MPFEEAIRFLLDKEQLPAEWDSAMWRGQEADFRTKAFFSAQVENARFLDRAQGLIFDYLAKTTEKVVGPDGVERVALRTAGREHFVKRMRDFMIAEGMARHEEFASVNQKDVEDLRSLARLRLIFDTNVRQAYGYGQWKQGMAPGALRAFPAARLIRDRGVKEPRLRHQIHLGEVRLKTDARWADYHNAKEIGGFGVPWGPYGFNSGVTQEDVSREEARELGLPVDRVAPVPGKLTDGTEASTRGMDSSLKAKLLAELRGGPKPADPREAARQAAAEVRKAMLQRGMDAAILRGDHDKAESYREALADLKAAAVEVREEGEKIVLGESVAQRLSKYEGSGGNATSEQQRQIAEKIFEMVDRKAAEPKTREKAKKGVNRSRQLGAELITLTPEESKILASPHEILLAYDEAGRLKTVVLGSSNEVALPDEIGPGWTLSHNHPSGRGPSDSDVKVVFSQPGMTLRIVTVNENSKREVFVLRSSSHADSDNAERAARFYKQACDEGNDSPEARRAALVLLLEQFPNIFNAASRIFP